MRRLWRFRKTAFDIAAIYLVGLIAINLVTSPQLTNTFAGVLANHIWPRLGAAQSQLDLPTVQQEWDLIQSQYVFRDITGQQGTTGAESGIITELQSLFKLDRFTAFLTKTEFDSLDQGLNNSRTGSIGIAITLRCAGGTACAQGAQPTQIMITEVLLGMPADKAGVRNGDVLVGVDGTTLPTTNLSSELDPVTQLVRGKAGTSVTLHLLRDGKPLDITVQRGDLTVPSVYAQRIGSVVYLEVTGFDTDTGSLAQKLLQQDLSGATGVILDLRENGGGYVASAQALASQFLSPSSSVTDVVVRRGRLAPNGDPNSAQTVSHDAVQSGGVATQPNLKVVVLVNGDTASAAEIVSAALHDYGRATLVGTTTFGKGSVQVDYRLLDGNDLHLTVEKWYGPKGENIDGVGITPDHVVQLANPDDRYRIDAQSVDPALDPQFEAALKLAQ